MNNFTSAFSLYEIFRILLPGTYICLAAFDFLEKWKWGFEVFKDSTLNTALDIIIIIIVGLFFYSFDFPRLIRKWQIYLPSVRIKNRHYDINEEIIRNSYFDFYENLEDKFKFKHEKYSGYFHLSINMLVISNIIFVTSIISCCNGYFSYFFYISLIIMLLSLVISLNIYYNRLKNSYQRHLEKYYKSSYYDKLLKNNN